MKTNKLLIPLLFTSTALLASAVCAESYNSEVGFLYGQSEFERGSSSQDLDGFIAAAEVYFDVVEIGSGPFEQAGFLAKQSSLVGAYSTVDVDKSNLETTMLVLELQHVIDDLVFGFGYSDEEIDTGLNSISSDSLALSAGSYVGEELLLLARYEWGDSGGVDVSSIGFSAKYVGDSGTGHFAVDADLSVIDIDAANANDGTSIELGATYYPSPQTGVGASFQLDDFDVTQKKTLELELGIYLNPKAAVFITYETSTEAAVGFLDVDGTSINVGASIRI